MIYVFKIVNLQDVRKGFVELRDGLKDIKSELGEHFANVDLNDTFISQMWSFVGKASGKLDDLQDDLNNADTRFKQAINYYGEEEKGMTSSEFYGIFKTFVTSYRASFADYYFLIAYKHLIFALKKSQSENRAAQQEREALERRRKAAEEAKESRPFRVTEGDVSNT